MRAPSSELEYLASEESPLGTVCLRRRTPLSLPGTPITEITLDHHFLMSSLNTESERALAEKAVAWHPGSGLNALVGGLGLGYTAQAVLGSERVARVETVEYLAPVIGWLGLGLLPLADALRTDARFRVTHGDVYARLLRPGDERFDLILIDVDHSPDEPLGGESDAFYRDDGLRSTRTHLAPDGVLGVWSYAECPQFADALARVFEEVRIETVRFDNPLFGEEEVNWLYFARG